MDRQRKRDILEKAKEVSMVSEKFQLSHATYACQTLIKEIVMDSFKKKYDLLSERIEQKMNQGLNYEKEQEEKNRLDFLIKQKVFHIDVTYIDTATEDTARVIKIANSFVINLSKSLAERIFDENGNYNYDVIRKIRKLMAHELGHLILHTEELLDIESTQGSKLITDEDKEEEAILFANEL